MTEGTSPMRAAARRIVGLLFALAACAYFVLLYLDSTLQPAVATVHRLRLGIAPLFFILLLALQVLQWRNRDIEASGPEPSQA